MSNAVLDMLRERGLLGGGRPAERFFGAPLYLAPGETVSAMRAMAAQVGGDPLERRAFFDLFDLDPPGPQVVGNITVVRVYGRLYRGFFWDDYAQLRKKIQGALDDSACRAIVLDIDSPGGRVAGCMELGTFIRQAAAGKPIWALANDQATSAAHLLGSSALRFYATRSGVVGSIGALCEHLDVSAWERERGLAFTEIASGKHKTDLSDHKALNKDGRAVLERLVDAAAESLFAAIASYRPKVTVEQLRAMEAGLFIGQEAVDNGLLDGVATLEEVLGLIQAELDAGSSTAFTNPAGDRSMSTPTPSVAAGTPAPQPAAAAPAATPAPAAAATDPTPPAAAAPSPSPTPTPAPAATAAAGASPESAWQQRATLISNACELAGRPELAGRWIAEGATLDAVQQRLLDLRARDGAGGEVNGHVPVNTAGQPKIDSSAIYRRWNNPADEKR